MVVVIMVMVVVIIVMVVVVASKHAMNDQEIEQELNRRCQKNKKQTLDLKSERNTHVTYMHTD
jgi:hypothetical protein